MLPLTIRVTDSDVLRTLKTALLSASKGVRLLESVADSEWRRSRLLILCYHSLAVDEEHLWRPPLFFSAEKFEERLQLLQRWRMNVLPLGEAVGLLRCGRLPPRSVVLTFDDGTADFYHVAMPLLKRYGYPATVYMTTYYSEKRYPIFLLMSSYLLWKGRRQRLEASPELGLMQAVDLSSDRQRLLAHGAIMDHADRERLEADQRDEMAAELARRLNIDYGDLVRRRVLHLMTPEEVRLATEAGADVQLHTHRHRTPRRKDLFDREIIDNRTRLDELTGRRTKHFCYPGGLVYPEFVPWLEAHEITTATTTAPGLALASTAPLLLPRIVDTAERSVVDLEGWLSGLSHLLPSRGRE